MAVGADVPHSRTSAAAAAATDDVLDRFELACGELESDRPEVYPMRQAQAAVQVLAVDAVGISVIIDEKKRIPLGASSHHAEAAESLEFTLGQGPCLDAHATGRPVLVPDLTEPSSRAWAQWPAYVEAMRTRTPFAAVFGFPLTSGGLSLGGVCMYRREAGELSLADLADALAVTNRIFYDLLDTGTFDGAATQTFRWLNMPLAKIRGMVWQAIGMATVELGLSSADALARLRSYCYGHNRLLDDVAADIVERRLPLDQLHP